MNNGKLGVLGGMGPEATSLFFDKIVENTIAEKDQEHIDIVLLNHATIPDRTSVIKNSQHELFLQAIKGDFELFEVANVNHIAIPCNTSHYFYEEMQQMTNIKIINMIDETVQILKHRYGINSKIGILATDGTIKTKLYEKVCDKNNLIPHNPNSTVQSHVMDIIYRVKKSIPVNPIELETIVTHMLEVENCTAVILGCTELSTIPLNKRLTKYIIDPLEVLVHKSIKLSNRESKFSRLYDYSKI